MAIQQRHRFQGCAALQWSQKARADRAEPLGRDRIKERAPRRVTRDMRDPRDGVHMARGPLLVKGQERGRCEGKHGARRHEGLW